MEDKAAVGSTEPLDDRVEHMEKQRSEKGPTRHDGGFALWSDGFLTSSVKQKEDSVWTLTMTFPDRGGSAT